MHESISEESQIAQSTQVPNLDPQPTLAASAKRPMNHHVDQEGQEDKSGWKPGPRQDRLLAAARILARAAVRAVKQPNEA